MKIELKNVQYAAFASEETNCFEATIYVDGIFAGALAVLNTLPEDAALACYLKYGSAAP